VATGSDRLVFFALDPAGAVLRADSHGQHPARAWHALGGRFTGAVTATVSAKAIDLLAQDKEGAIFHRSVPVEAGEAASDWQRIGAAMPAQFAALPLEHDGLAVFALDHKGVVQHQEHRHGQWRSEGWRAIPGATGLQLGASATAGQGLALALIDTAMHLHTLTWRGYPEGNPDHWVAQGDLQTWLVRPTGETAAAQPPISAVA
jgi:hypothetical protein